MGREVEINSPLLRIISIVPSQTELLVDLGLEKNLVGITKFCIYPKDLKNCVEQVGGTKNLTIQKIIALKPDLIIGNKEENSLEDIQELEKLFPVWMSDIYSLDDALEMISQLGQLTDTSEKANVIVTEISSQFSVLKPLSKRKSCLYLIWRKPFMAAAKNTFIDDLLNRLGFENSLSVARYPEVDLTKLNPEVILLSSEPYPFKNKHIEEIKLIHPNAEVSLVDGEFFSWYGSRLLSAVSYFENLLNESK